MPEMLAAFITPNHPEIARVIIRASEILQKWTGKPSFDIRTALIGETGAKILLKKLFDQNTTLESVTVKGNLIIRDSSKKRHNK